MAESKAEAVDSIAIEVRTVAAEHISADTQQASMVLRMKAVDRRVRYYSDVIVVFDHLSRRKFRLCPHYRSRLKSRLLRHT
jgi:hypothetical protein